MQDSGRDLSGTNICFIHGFADQLNFLHAYFLLVAFERPFWYKSNRVDVVQVTASFTF